MDEHSIKLLKECSSGCQMAMESVKKMREYTKDAKLNDLLEVYGEKHRELEGEISGRLRSFGKYESEPKKMAELMAKAEMDVKMLVHPNDHQVAKIMMDGCNMGIQSVSEYINKYTDASQDSQDVAKKLIGIEEDFMQEMKGFV